MAIAGLVGAILSAPGLAIAIAVSRRVRTPEMVPGAIELSSPAGPAPDARPPS